MFNDQKYSFSLFDFHSKKIVIQSKVNIFQQIQPKYIVKIQCDRHQQTFDLVVVGDIGVAGKHFIHI